MVCAARFGRRHARTLAHLISPDRWDVIVRARFLAAPEDASTFADYERWFHTVAWPRFGVRDRRHADDAFTERIEAARALAAAYRDDPTLPDRLPPVVLDERGATLWDGGHRLALRLLRGDSQLPPWAYRRSIRPPLRNTGAMWALDRPGRAAIDAFLGWRDGPVPPILISR